MKHGVWGVALIAGLAAPLVQAEPTRVPVLNQVTHPHSYYWREMYMPQLTSGPSSASFSPDGSMVVYSMQGSLWQQRIGDDTAYELTSGPGYDFQPDWSPDGHHIVFTRQHGNALNLMQLDTGTGVEVALTTGDAVNLEPKWSPDGTKIAFVSSKDKGALGIYVAAYNEGGLQAPKPLIAGRVSETYRYYYSAADHAINPAWSADSKTIYYVSNPENAWGTGDIWAAAADGSAPPKRLIEEETTWAARPQPDHAGKRLLYASYRGRQWHQLWLSTIEGKYPLPITFGEYDIWQPRWSPDDQHLLYVSNESGGLELFYHSFVGGERLRIEAKKRVYKHPVQPIEILLKDGYGRAIAGRVSVLGVDGRHYAPYEARIHGDDYVDTAKADHETHYFNCPKRCTVMVPEGKVSVQASHGFSHQLANQEIEVSGAPATLALALNENKLPTMYGRFTSVDMHVHMNYGGKYKQTLKTMAADAAAEDLDVVYNLIVNKEERIPDISQFKLGPERFGSVTIYQGQEYHSSYWGHMGLLHLDDHYLTPDFSSYWHTGLASPYPSNAAIQDLAHKQGAVTGYVHPFDDAPDPGKDARLTNSLPVDVALGKTDYLEVVSFANHQNTAGVWYRFLNLGFRLAAGAGTDAMTNYASLRGPIGLNRVFLDGVTSGKPNTLKAAIREGHSFVSNGPLLGLLADKAKPGAELSFGPEGGTVQIKASVRSPVPVERFELVMNGKVVKTFKLGEDGMNADGEMKLPVTESGWVLVRAVSETAHPFVQDIYTYATTNPVWLTMEGKPQSAPEDAAYFINWLDRIREHAAARSDYNAEWERGAVMDEIALARKVFEGKH